MNITTNGHSFEDAVRQILQLFFDLNSEFDVESSLQIEENSYIAKAKVTLGENTAEGEIKATLFSPEKRQVSDIIKKSVFFACKKLSDMPTPWGISTGIRPAKTARMMLDENKTDEEILSYMENEFFITTKKAKLSLAVAKKEFELLKDRKENTVSLYLGVPFCPTRCAYCSFISQALAHNQKFVKPYVDALIKEIEATAKMAESFGYKAETIYFGGGTPTTLSPEALERLIKRVKSCFDVSLLREFTVEAGRPDTFSDEMLATLWENGVNRISINPQTMNQKTLDKIGRRHSVEDTIKAFEMTKKYNFSINADLIAGLPDESTEDFRKTVEEVCALSPDAVTVHTMYLKRAARLISDFEKLRFAKDMDSMVQLSYDYLTDNGYNPYYLYKQKNTLGNLENVGFSKEGHESLYNIFIMEEIQTILAMGGGASTKMVKGDRIERVFNPKEASDYINRIDEIIEKKKTALEFLR
ncbi:MAG: coproporphyrinogen dehydrogenase HemZ [Ruminococcaceae bacterium]|nr:coproporphyrinogen dehydrogenase HemZ [Oscillospiraceae bacterium]